MVSETESVGGKMITVKTEKGIEQYWDTSDISKGCVVFSYGFLANNGTLFQCVKCSLEECRAARDIWLRDIEVGG